MIKLTLPTTPDEIRKLKAGDEVSITGVMVTARDAAHKYLVETEAEDVRDLLKGSMIYHCGPVVRKGDDGKYTFVAAGPTTSIREEPYEAAVIDKYEVRGVPKSVANETVDWVGAMPESQIAEFVVKAGTPAS